jgi:hypothetical protein
MHSALPSHLVEVLSTGDGAHNFGDNSGMVRCCDALTFSHGPLEVCLP